MEKYKIGNVEVDPRFDIPWVAGYSHRSLESNSLP